MNTLVEQILQGALAVGALLVCIIPHEVAHGYVAWKLGDPTAKHAGRLTLNPLKHLDPVGSFLVPLGMLVLQRLVGFPVVFGWARPVPINPYYFRDTWRGLMWVGLAGPLTNVTLGLLAAGLGHVLLSLGLFPEWVLAFLAMVVLISFVLAFFNLIPVPPLDGSRVVAYFLPVRWRLKLLQLERFGFLVVIALLFLGVFRVVFSGAEAVALRLLGWRWALGIGLWP